jgi:hypothetical protein
MDANLRTRWTPLAFRVTFDRTPDVGLGAVVAATDRIGNGFLVEDCTFGHNRSRAVLIKASDGLVIGNTLVGCREEAVKVAPEYWWLESGSSNHVRIEGNRVASTRRIPIAVYAHGGGGAVAPAGAHRDITILGNTISDCPLPGIAVTSTAGLLVKDNVLSPCSDPRESPQAIRALGLDRSKPEPIMIKDCSDVTMSDNHE